MTRINSGPLIHTGRGFWTGFDQAKTMRERRFGGLVAALGRQSNKFLCWTTNTSLTIHETPSNIRITAKQLEMGLRKINQDSPIIVKEMGKSSSFQRRFFAKQPASLFDLRYLMSAIDQAKPLIGRSGGHMFDMADLQDLGITLQLKTLEENHSQVVLHMDLCLDRALGQYIKIDLPIPELLV